MRNYIAITILTLLMFNCKSDKKTTIEEPEKIVIEDTIPDIVIDTIPEPIIDSLLVVEKPIKVIETPKKIDKQESIQVTKNNFITESNITMTPIEHGTMVLEYNGTTIYVDPVGGMDLYKKHKAPNFILITDIHGDHLSTTTLEAINTPNTIIIGPKAVKAKLPTSLLKNYTTLFSGLSRNFSTSKMSLEVEGVAMYNIREDAKKFHPKGRGLGYVITINNKRIYISGDTEDTFEMRHLKNIDIAFVCMNLPYTMTVESAASAVLEFKPKKVVPYHYKGTNGFSNIKKFKSIVNRGNSRIKVTLLDWYN
jgi:L-ascorbate metabolism protein UlaG (beta-lactamase superfamily)